MGAYLSSPKVEKRSSDLSWDEKYACGVSGMQGWRISMEDAHNCILHLDEDTSLFAVYDGHGGGEVALYCSYYFADVLKQTDEYKTGKLAQALKTTFMTIDRKLKDPNINKLLKFLSEREPGDPPPTEDDVRNADDDDDDHDEDETRLLYEEADMDIEKLLAKYGRVASKTEEAINRNNISIDDQSDSDSVSGRSKHYIKNSVEENSLNNLVSLVNSAQKKLKSQENNSSKMQDSSIKEPNIAIALEDDKEAQQKTDSGYVNKIPKLKKTFVKTKTSKGNDSEDEDYFESESESESESECDDELSGWSEDESSEEESCQQNSDHNQDQAAQRSSVSSEIEEPGYDSGTTAVVALLRGNMLYVANAGDSRCVLCRKDGKALDMSNDHKPEDEIELKRITRAGGHVNIQGRVNGGLNLSRAIGDHCYKANPDLPLEEQMITAVPDVTSVKLEHTDEFLVLACDGIWNVKSSQDVTDFIKGELFEDKNSKLSLICEKLFDICLAPDTMGDGSGCDNMTCIIVQFNPTWLSSLQNIVKDPVVYHDNIKKNVKDFSSVSLVKATVKPNNDLKINNVKRSRTEDNDVTNNVPKHIIKNEPKRQKSI